jgi:hypothetical protein
MNPINNSNNNYKSSSGFGSLTEMTLTDLQEMALRQQKQIEINQQLLLAKEKRLKALKLDEQRNQQLAMQSQGSFLSHQQQQQGFASNSSMATTTTNENTQKLENLKQNVLGQELKIFKLKQLRNQIIANKVSNTNMYSELDLIKSLFSEKERELYNAINKVAELTKQIEQLRKIKTLSVPNKSQPQTCISPVSMNASELEKLKAELQIRNTLNETQSKKISLQRDELNKKQMEVLSLDTRIEDLKGRIANKRSKLSEQMGSNVLLASNQRNSVMQDFNSVLIDQQNSQQQQQQQQQQQMQLLQALNHDQNQQQHALRQQENNKTNKTQNQTENQQNSPSKLVPPQFASKQVIANTYMNKYGYGSEVLQKYRMQSQQQQQQHQKPTAIIDINHHIKQASNDETSTSSETTSTSSSHTNLPSSSSSLASLSPISNTNQKSNNNNNNINNNEFQMNAYQHQQQQPSTLSSHVKLEFDKLKYLPDMGIKTIKKRHSISEIEGSPNTLPPQVYQKIIENHHKNFLEQKSNSQKSAAAAAEGYVPPASVPIVNMVASTPQLKLNKIAEETSKADFFKSFNGSGSDHLLSFDSSTSPNTTITSVASKTMTTPNNTKTTQETSKSNVFLASFLPSNLNVTNLANEPTPALIELTPTVKSTKSIIKPSNQHVDQLKRVNFDPHALLLDAAVEGELDLVVKCAKLVKDVSEPNDEGITALHNSVCAGHFDIVKFLVEFGCDINYADNDGWTPLHCAASCNNLQMIKFLIENGAAVFATTVSDNETAIRKCEEDEEGYEACFDYLKEAQASLGSGLVYALYSYEKLNEDEMSFQRFDQMHVVDKHEDESKDEANDGWWTCKMTQGNRQEGLVPKNFLGAYPRIEVEVTNKNQESTVC